ncbi:hypothetical protein ACFQH2_05925 [Natronoarchaeum sp. GCM10025703]|uniref:hypothetical protein n=1 Tax=unclassified Natronoarchaeum TaxID=2620183 RepID=UPI00361F863F
MDDSYVEEALDDAEAAFQRTAGQTTESDLDISDDALVQLRKACRLLEADERFAAETDTTLSSSRRRSWQSNGVSSFIESKENT